MLLSFLHWIVILLSMPLCYLIAKKKHLGATRWVILSFFVGPVAIPFLLLRKSKPPALYKSREEAYEAYRKGEKRYYEIHAKVLNVGMRVFGGMLIFVGIVGLVGMFY